MCATATASRRSDGKYSATISPAARSSPSPPWQSPKPRLKFRVTPSSAASSCGAMDVAARVTAEYVGKALGQSIVIENRPGGGGNLGAEAIAKAPPDGYTI